MGFHAVVGVAGDGPERSYVPAGGAGPPVRTARAAVLGKLSAKKRAAAASTRAKVPEEVYGAHPHAVWRPSSATGLSPNAMIVRMLMSIPISLSDRTA